MGTHSSRPLGTVVHGSRSGTQNSQLQEYKGTANFAAGGADGLWWNVTCGPGRYTTHGPVQSWGWHAGEESKRWLGAELAQAQLDDPVDDLTFLALATWFRDIARVRWPSLPARFRTHSEMPQGIDVGKTDLTRAADADKVRARIQRAFRTLDMTDEVT